MAKRLGELLDETRGVGFEEFLESMERAIAKDTRPEAQRSLRFARAFLTALVETARAETGDDPSPEEWADTVTAAFGGVGWALPCFVAAGVKQGATSEVVAILLAECFTPILMEVSARQDGIEEDVDGPDEPGHDGKKKED